MCCATDAPCHNRQKHGGLNSRGNLSQHDVWCCVAVLPGGRPRFTCTPPPPSDQPVFVCLCCSSTNSPSDLGPDSFSGSSVSTLIICLICCSLRCHPPSPWQHGDKSMSVTSSDSSGIIYALPSPVSLSLSPSPVKNCRNEGVSLPVGHQVGGYQYVTHHLHQWGGSEAQK